MITYIKRVGVSGIIMAGVLSTSLGGLTATPAAAQVPGGVPRAGAGNLVAQPTPPPQRQQSNPMHFWCGPGGPAHNYPICNGYTYPHPDYP